MVVLRMRKRRPPKGDRLSSIAAGQGQGPYGVGASEASGVEVWGVVVSGAGVTAGAVGFTGSAAVTGGTTIGAGAMADGAGAAAVGAGAAVWPTPE